MKNIEQMLTKLDKIRYRRDLAVHKKICKLVGSGSIVLTKSILRDMSPWNLRMIRAIKRDQDFVYLPDLLEIFSGREVPERKLVEAYSRSRIIERIGDIDYKFKKNRLTEIEKLLL